MTPRIGIDFTSIADVRAALAGHGGRYLARTYTAAERARCGTDPRGLAACFAAKEAAVKALAPAPDDAVPWTDLDVEDHARGSVVVRFRRRAAEVAARRGVVCAGGSVSPLGADLMSAVVIATGTDRA